MRDETKTAHGMAGKCWFPNKESREGGREGGKGKPRLLVGLFGLMRWQFAPAGLAMMV